MIYLKSTELEKSTFEEPLSSSGKELFPTPPSSGPAADNSGSFSRQATLKQAMDDLRHSDPKIRIMAARFLQKVDPRVAVPLLKEALSDRDPRVRMEGLSTLAGQRDDVSLVPMFQACLKDEDSRVRIAGLRAIFKNRKPLDLSVLVPLSGDPSPLVRRKLATLLGWTTDEGAVPMLAALSKDPDPKVRQAVLVSLSALDRRSCEDRLMKAMADPDPELRRWARERLGKRISKSVTRRTIRIAE